jgi:hypothetical protein
VVEHVEAPSFNLECCQGKKPPKKPRNKMHQTKAEAVAATVVKKVAEEFQRAIRGRASYQHLLQR